MLASEDAESSECHLRGILVRDLSRCVSNYRATQTLPEYCQERNVIGISEIDTRALTKRIREKGSLVGVMTTDEGVSDDELVEMAKNWTIVGKDLLSVVSCSEPYEWKDPTWEEWEFSKEVKEVNGTSQFHVGVWPAH